jgi:formylglycine-generating enzyme required for sulfatase activity
MNPPTKPSDTRVYRGGSWGNYVPSWVRAASRFTYVPADRINNIGFRCALRGREPRT